MDDLSHKICLISRYNRDDVTSLLCDYSRSTIHAISLFVILNA